jgi:DNA-binding NarL/FixJ family response regulator
MKIRIMQNNGKSLKIIIADDNETFRKGLIFYIEEILGHQIIGEASNGKELLNLQNIQIADILLIDIEMPELNGVEATRKLNWMFREIKVIAISAYSDKAYLQQLIGAGFKGYVIKKNIFNDLPEALDCVMKNVYYFTPEDREIIGR